MRRFLAAAAALLFSADLAFSATLIFPSDAPVALITIPDSWKPEETETGVDAVSDDEGVYFSVDVAGDDNMETIITDAFKYLEENGVKADPATQKDTKDTLNGMPFEAIDWSGTDEEGPVSIGVGILGVKADKLLVITYWGAKDREDRNMPEVGKILASIKAAN
ncbi:histidine kinase [Ciceribacter thiooxidans]|uniref:Histidine kinase n=1 Tax=Ciceribacter thiooxidans TaxID=1969821 RepID=A0ABV7HZB0_9HYPH|nr:histidine kinase [Ciceribacter thiooxidans]